MEDLITVALGHRIALAEAREERAARKLDEPS